MELKSTHSEIFTWIIHVYIIIFHLNHEELLESPRRHPDPSPACLLTSEGLERALIKSQFFTPLSLRVTEYKIIRNCILLLNQGKRCSLQPLFGLIAPGPSRMASSHIGSAEKSFAKPSHKNIVGSSLGDGSGDDLDDVTLDDRADEDVIG